MRFKSRAFFIHTEPGLGYFRLFGFGLGWKDTRRHPLLFSERNGHTPHAMVGAWSIAPIRQGA